MTGSCLGHLTRWDVLAAVAAGGAAGAGARHGVSELLPGGTGGFPWATFAVNVTGCFLLGALMVVLLDRRAGSRFLRPLLGVGVLGGYTSFSAYALDTRDLVAAGHADVAGAYLIGTVAATLVAMWLGVLTGRGVHAAALVMARRGGRRPAVAAADLEASPPPSEEMS